MWDQIVLFAYLHDVFVKLKITETKFKLDQCKLPMYKLANKQLKANF